MFNPDANCRLTFTTTNPTNQDWMCRWNRGHSGQPPLSLLRPSACDGPSIATGCFADQSLRWEPSFLMLPLSSSQTGARAGGWRGTATRIEREREREENGLGFRSFGVRRRGGRRWREGTTKAVAAMVRAQLRPRRCKSKKDCIWKKT